MLLIVIRFFVPVVMHLETYEIVWYEVSYKYVSVKELFQMLITV
jgi:hypothetical protein